MSSTNIGSIRILSSASLVLAKYSIFHCQTSTCHLSVCAYCYRRTNPTRSLLRRREHRICFRFFAYVCFRFFSFCCPVDVLLFISERQGIRLFFAWSVAIEIAVAVSHAGQDGNLAPLGLCIVMGRAPVLVRIFCSSACVAFIRYCMFVWQRECPARMGPYHVLGPLLMCPILLETANRPL